MNSNNSSNLDGVDEEENLNEHGNSVVKVPVSVPVSSRSSLFEKVKARNIMQKPE